MSHYIITRKKPMPTRWGPNDIAGHQQGMVVRTDKLLPTGTKGRVTYNPMCSCGWRALDPNQPYSKSTKVYLWLNKRMADRAFANHVDEVGVQLSLTEEGATAIELIAVLFLMVMMFVLIIVAIALKTAGGWVILAGFAYAGYKVYERTKKPPPGDKMMVWHKGRWQ